MPRVSVIYTIGHSVHTEDAFVDLLNAHGIRQLADIRTVPASRRYPHFSKERLAAFLARHGVVVTTVCPGLMRTGSHINAEFKGRHEGEYAWFALGGSMLFVAFHQHGVIAARIGTEHKKRASFERDGRATWA